MADSRQPAQVAITPPVFENPVYRDPIRFPQVEELENNLKKEFRQDLVELAKELLLELTR
jgi:hypothetical protein